MGSKKGKRGKRLRRSIDALTAAIAAVDARLAVVEEDVDTLGGLALVLAGHVPQQGEIVEHPSGWRLEITEGDARRVNRMRLHAPPETATE